MRGASVVSAAGGQTLQLRGRRTAVHASCCRAGTRRTACGTSRTTLTRSTSSATRPSRRACCSPSLSLYPSLLPASLSRLLPAALAVALLLPLPQHPPRCSACGAARGSCMLLIAVQAGWGRRSSLFLLWGAASLPARLSMEVLADAVVWLRRVCRAAMILRSLSLS
jgi:hypothetical protein